MFLYIHILVLLRARKNPQEWKRPQTVGKSSKLFAQNGSLSHFFTVQIQKIKIKCYLCKERFQ